MSSSDFCALEGLTIEPDDMIIITSPRGKHIVIENFAGKMDLHGRVVDEKAGPVIMVDVSDK